MAGIYVLYRAGRIEGYCESLETIERIQSERPDAFDIQFVKGKIAKKILENYNEMQFIEEEAMSYSEYEWLMMALEQLPIDIEYKMDKVLSYLELVKDDDIKPVIALVNMLKNKAEYNRDQYDADYSELWNMEYCRKSIL